MPKGVFTRIKVPARIRFAKKFVIGEPDDCWEWKSKGKAGKYPNFSDGVKQIGAHRYALQLKLGRELKPGELACHKCDNSYCVNPNHIFLGTDLDNSRDMVKKGRKEQGATKFTERY